MKFDETSPSQSTEKVIDLASFRKKKEMDDDLAHGRRPLYVSHLKGSVSGDEESREFGDRLTRIRSSLDKINRLMGELKKISADAEQNSERKGSLDRRK